MPDLLSIVWWRKFYSRVGRGFGWGCALVFGIPLVIGFGWNQYGGSGRGNSRQADANAVIAAVNGETITEALFRNSIPTGSGSGEQHAKIQGQVLNQLVQSAVIRQMAKKYNVQVSEADVDRKVAEEREQRLGKNATDAQWEEYVMQVHGMSPSEYRDSLARDASVLIPALLEKFKSKELVTPDDVKQQNQEVQARLVQIGYGRTPFGDPKKHAKALTEAEAEKKAEDLLAKAKAGSDVAQLARANSTDFTKDKGGDLGFLPEYKKQPNQMGMGGPAQEMLASSYGKDFAEAVHKTPVGQFTGIVKTSMFGTTGFAFAKVENRRDTPAAKPDPKNPNASAPPADPKKITEDLKQQRASEKLGKEFKAAFKSASVVFKPEGADEKAYYDYAKLEEMQSQADNARMMTQFGQPVEDVPPTMAEIESKRTMVNAELDALLKKHPDDPTIALLVARNLKTKMDLAPSDQKVALRDQLIVLNQTALKGIEDRNIRFDLAELYRDKGDLTNAEAAYQKISHLMDIAPGYDTSTLTEEQAARKRLVNGFRAINKPQEVAAEESKLTTIEAKLAESRRKAAEQQRSTQMPNSVIPPGKSTRGTLSLPGPKLTGTPKK
jgi:parvulin-like peptidyl-prolyl isomerase